MYNACAYLISLSRRMVDLLFGQSLIHCIAERPASFQLSCPEHEGFGLGVDFEDMRTFSP